MAAGGVHVAWVLAESPRAVKTRNGERILVQLRDPARLSQAMLLWLDGPIGALADLRPGVVLPLHLESVRGSKTHGELVGNVQREVVDAAAARARGAVA